MVPGDVATPAIAAKAGEVNGTIVLALVKNSLMLICARKLEKQILRMDAVMVRPSLENGAEFILHAAGIVRFIAPIIGDVAAFGMEVVASKVPDFGRFALVRVDPTAVGIAAIGDTGIACGHVRIAVGNFVRYFPYILAVREWEFWGLEES